MKLTIGQHLKNTFGSIDWDSLSAEESADKLAEIAQETKDFYARGRKPAPREVTRARDFLSGDLELLTETVRTMAAFGSTLAKFQFMYGAHVRPSGSKIDREDTLDWEQIDRLREIRDESFRIKYDRLAYEYRPPVIEQSKIGAGKNPMAMHTIRKFVR